MTRKLLTASLREAAVKLGYCFYSGFDYRMNETIIAYPAVWLLPPRVVGVEGLGEGRICYSLELQLMTLAGKSTPEEKEEAWGNLEWDAVELYRQVARSAGVLSATVLECAPGEFSMTNHGELSVSLKMEVEVPFCNH